MRVKKIDKYGQMTIKEIIAAQERDVTIVVNGKRKSKITCTPAHLEELAVGWMYAEGRISAIGDVRAISMEGTDEECCAGDISVFVEISNRESEKQDRALRSQTKTVSKDVVSQEQQFRKISESDLPVILGKLRDMFETQLPESQRIGASHGCMLAEIKEDGDVEALFQSEDTSRHSAMDKAIGWGVINDAPLERCILLTSGRINYEMVNKAAGAGVMILASIKQAVTEKAIRHARENGLMLCTISKEKEVNVYSNYY